MRSIAAEMYACDAKNLHSPKSGLAALPPGLDTRGARANCGQASRGLHLGRLESLGFDARQELSVLEDMRANGHSGMC